MIYSGLQEVGKMVSIESIRSQDHAVETWKTCGSIRRLTCSDFVLPLGASGAKSYLEPCTSRPEGHKNGEAVAAIQQVMKADEAGPLAWFRRRSRQRAVALEMLMGLHLPEFLEVFCVTTGVGLELL